MYISYLYVQTVTRQCFCFPNSQWGVTAYDTSLIWPFLWTSGTIQTNLFSHTISDCLFEIFMDHLVLTKDKDLSDAPLFCATRWTFYCTSWVSLCNETIETFPLPWKSIFDS